MHPPETWILIAICVVIIGAIALLVIKTNPRCSKAIQRWQQRRVVRRLKRQIPKQLKEDKERLGQLWNGNPAAQCATIFNRLNRLEESEQELADDIDRALTVASSHFEENFTDRYADLYADLYAKRVVVRTTETAHELVTQYPENAPLILQRLSQNDTEISRRFNESIRDALAEGQGDQEEIRAHIKQLMENSDRFRRLLTPGFFRKYSSWLFGGGVTLALHELLPDWIKGPWLELKTTKFAAGIFANFKSKRDQEFGHSFAKVLAVELPALCEDMDTRVGQSLSAALDRYIEHKLKQQRAVLDVLLELSHRKCDVESGISWFRNTLPPNASAAPPNWPRSFAAAVVVALIAAACAVWLYSPFPAKAPATTLAGNKEVATVAGKSQMNTSVPLPGTAPVASADQSKATSVAVTTPVPPTPPEYLQRRADTVRQKEVATNQSEGHALQSASPEANKYPFGRYAGPPSFYYSPYTGRAYDLRGVREGGLVRDPVTGQLFRRPWREKQSDSRGR